MPTQVNHPVKATLRTVFAAAVVLVPTYVVIVPEVLAGLGDYIPPAARAWLAGSVVFVTALIATLTRIMALPAVNDALTRFGLGAEPKAKGKHEADSEAPTLF